MYQTKIQLPSKSYNYLTNFNLILIHTPIFHKSIHFNTPIHLLKKYSVHTNYTYPLKNNYVSKISYISNNLRHMTIYLYLTGYIFHHDYSISLQVVNHYGLQ